MSDFEGPVDTGTGAEESVAEVDGTTASAGKDGSGSEGNGERLNTKDAAAVQKAAKNNQLPEEMLDRVYTITVDGETREMTVRDMAKLTSFEQASQKRFREAAETSKKIQAFVEEAKRDPETALRKFGYTPEQIEQLSESVLRRKITEMQMSPEQRKEQEERQKFAEERKQFQTQSEIRIREEIDHGMTTAFKESGMPKSPFLAARVAHLVAQSVEKVQKTRQGEPLSYAEAAAKVKVWFQNSTRETLSSLKTPKEKLDFLGPELVRELQQALVSQIKGTAPTSSSTHRPSPNGEQAQSIQKPKQPFRHWKDYQKYVDSL